MLLWLPCHHRGERPEHDLNVVVCGSLSFCAQSPSPCPVFLFVMDLLFDRHDLNAGKWLQLVVNLYLITGKGPQVFLLFSLLPRRGKGVRERKRRRS